MECRWSVLGMRLRGGFTWSARTGCGVLRYLGEVLRCPIIGMSVAGFRTAVAVRTDSGFIFPRVPYCAMALHCREYR